MLTIFCSRRLLERILFLVVLLGFPPPVSFCFAGEGSHYQHDLQESAQRLNLWQSPMWHALLHMGRGKTNESRIDSPEFFFSPDGNRDPVAEGVATLNAFFQPFVSNQEESHPQCLYPARYCWLKEQLSFDSDFLPEQSCPSLTHWLEAMEPDGISLIFPESYLNNPASMFGHTFLRVEQKNGRSPLLAPSINFAAITDEKPSLKYALKGLFGGYPGKFSVGLYVDQVRTYGAIENRDIYEYRLGLNAAETRFLLLHVWELKRASFDYFFIDENCSYQLLALLEVARPSLDFTKKIQSVALPVETIRLVSVVPGLLQGVSYRPSRRTALQKKAENFSKDQLQMVRAFAEEGRLSDEVLRNSWNGDNGEGQAEVIEASLELLLYNQFVATGKSDADDPILQHLLELRSRLEVRTLRNNPSSPPPVRPDQGHGAARAGISMGVDDTNFFVQLGFRPVLHDLMDPGPGYVDGAQVDFFSTELRYYPEQEQVKLHTLDLLHIISLAPRDRLVQPISWTARIGMNQMRYAGAGDRLTGRAMTGFGLTTEITDEIIGYGLITGELLASDQFEYGWNIGLGPVVGIRSGFDRWNFTVQAQGANYFLYQDEWSWSLQFVQALNVTPDFSLRLRITGEQEFSGPTTETVFSLFWYF